MYLLLSYCFPPPPSVGGRRHTTEWAEAVCYFVKDAQAGKFNAAQENEPQLR